MMKAPYNIALLDHLSTFLTPKRVELIRDKVAQRTRYLTVVLEDIYQSHNVSAVVRSCECFGVQDIHIIENRYAYELSPNVAMGSSKWVNLLPYNQEGSNTQACLDYMKQKGYQIVAATPHIEGYAPEKLPLGQPVSLWFGTEREGLSGMVLDQADMYLTIPMVGFTESLNLSVSAAISLYTLTSRLRNASLLWQLSEDEKLTLLLEWMRASVRKADLIEAAFQRSYHLED